MPIHIQPLGKFRRLMNFEENNERYKKLEMLKIQSYQRYLKATIEFEKFLHAFDSDDFTKPKSSTSAVGVPKSIIRSTSRPKVANSSTEAEDYEHKQEHLNHANSDSVIQVPPVLERKLVDCTKIINTSTSKIRSRQESMSELDLSRENQIYTRRSLTCTPVKLKGRKMNSPGLSPMKLRMSLDDDDDTRDSLMTMGSLNTVSLFDGGKDGDSIEEEDWKLFDRKCQLKSR